MGNGNGDKAPKGAQPSGTTGLSSDVKWMMIGAIAAAIIAIGIAAVAVSVTMLPFSRPAADMRHHEHRTNASNSKVILALQMLVDGMRDDYRDRMHGVEDVLRELQQIRQRLQDKDEDENRETRRRELERASSRIEQALTGLMLFRPVRNSDVTQRVEEIRNELKAIRKHLGRKDESEDDSGDQSEDDSGDGCEDEGGDESEGAAECVNRP